MDFVGVHTSRYVQQVSDVLRAIARGQGAVRAAFCRPVKGRSQSASGGGERREGGGRRGRLQLRVTVGLHAQGGGGKELLGPRQVLTLLQGKHG